MDRVDRWLNAQRGWRRLLIGWLVVAPALLDTGLAWSAWGNLDDQSTVPTGSVLVHVAVAAVAGIPLAAVLAGLHSWRRKSRPWAPGFAWRMIVGIYVFMSGACIATYGDTRTLAWRHQHATYKALFLSDAVYCVFLIWHGLYYRKLRRQAEVNPGPPRTDA